MYKIYINIFPNGKMGVRIWQNKNERLQTPIVMCIFIKIG